MEPCFNRITHITRSGKIGLQDWRAQCWRFILSFALLVGSLGFPSCSRCDSYNTEIAAREGEPLFVGLLSYLQDHGRPPDALKEIPVVAPSLFRANWSLWRSLNRKSGKVVGLRLGNYSKCGWEITRQVYVSPNLATPAFSSEGLSFVSSVLDFYISHQRYPETLEELSLPFVLESSEEWSMSLTNAFGYASSQVLTLNHFELDGASPGIGLAVIYLLDTGWEVNA